MLAYIAHRKLNCPVCTHGEFSFYRNFVHLSHEDADPQAAKISKGSDLYIGLICTQCGYLLHFDARKAKIPAFKK